MPPRRADHSGAVSLDQRPQDTRWNTRTRGRSHRSIFAFLRLRGQSFAMTKACELLGRRTTAGLAIRHGAPEARSNSPVASRPWSTRPTASARFRFVAPLAAKTLIVQHFMTTKCRYYGNAERA